MADETLKTEGFEPIYAAHAIEQVAFIVQFDRPFDNETFHTIKALADQFKDELPGNAEIQGFSIAFGVPVVAQAEQNQSINGLVRRSVARDGSLECELRIERSVITFVTTRYTRWSNVWEQANKYLNAILPHYLKSANLIAVGLNYVDKFVWNGDLNKANAKYLLRNDSKYICNHIFETDEFWHSHTGAFIRVDDITRRLLNINLDYLDELRPEGQKRIVSITTTVTDQFNQPGYGAYLSNDNSIGLINTHMQNMHDFGKTVLEDLITENMSKRIALIGQDNVTN